MTKDLNLENNQYNTIVVTIYYLTNKETRTLKESLPLLLKRRLFTKFQHVRFRIFYFFNKNLSLYFLGIC